MIISASRRSDLPAFYTPWLLERLAQGWCLVANPFNPRQVSRLSLARDQVEAMVLWTKNPAPLLARLDELDRPGFAYYFLYTLNPYPPDLEPHLPPLEQRLATFQALATRLGPDRVVWRYDPIIISNRTPPAWHEQAFASLSRELAGACQRVIVSLVHPYAKTRRRLGALAQRGWEFSWPAWDQALAQDLLATLARLAAGQGMTMAACASPVDLRSIGVEPARCIDPQLIARIGGPAGLGGTDPGQRPECGCAPSRDMGAPDTCLHGCEYCYACVSQSAALANHQRHDPAGPFLLPPLQESGQGQLFTPS